TDNLGFPRMQAVSVEVLRCLHIGHASILDQAHGLKLELPRELPSLHDPPPVPSKHLTRYLRNRVQARPVPQVLRGPQQKRQNRRRAHDREKLKHNVRALHRPAIAWNNISSSTSDVGVRPWPRKDSRPEHPRHNSGRAPTKRLAIGTRGSAE